MALQSSDGMVWYSESGVKPNAVVQFDPGKRCEADIPSRRRGAEHGGYKDGRVYIACSKLDKVGVVHVVTNAERKIYVS
jgi:hypothetical protein